MKVARALIVDDERLARQELRKLLTALTEVEVVGECTNAEEAVREIEAKRPDLLFLDIQMPGKNGFELLRSLDHAPEVIFVSAYDEYAIRAFEVNALDYLLKPVQPQRLAESVRKALERIGGTVETPVNIEQSLTEEDQVFVKDGDRCWFVRLSEIRLFESEGNYVRLFFGEHRPLILRSLNNLDEKLNARVFFRASRKHIINLKWVENMENWYNGGLLVKLKGGGEKVEISRRQAARLKEMMSL
ncbi:MAG: response regulator [Bacteroidia bacterium]|nr:response regulator [Bacteroidia bacterium]